MFENNEDEVHGALGRADIPAMISHTGFGSWPNICLSGKASLYHALGGFFVAFVP
jgi:hypothetical protein